jgi:hypothetical protein
MRRSRSIAVVFAGACLSLLARADDAGAPSAEKLEKAYPATPAYSPYAGRDFPVQPYFGDTHLHTSFSMDAGAFGARLGPRDAYRFARGEQVTASMGQPVKLSRPLDFLVVADHSDNMGFFPDLFAGKPEILADPTGRKWYDMIQSGQGAQAAIEIIVAFSHGTFPRDLMYFPGTRAYRNAWQETIAAAEAYDEPGRFTAFIGYEWTSNTGGNNLHRNVIFRDGGERAGQVDPFTVYPPAGSDDPRDLWKWMAAYEQKTGGSVLAIAHNGNLSNGTMFPVIESFTGRRVDRAYAEQRARWERLYEVTQTKGTGEAHPYLSPNDELAAFELWDRGNLDGSAAKKKEMLEFEYARSAFKTGLALEQRLGTNPCRLPSATPGASRWAGICALRPRASHPRSWSRRSRTRSARTSTASRSSRAGSIPGGSCRRRSTTWSGAMRTSAGPVPTASSRPSGARSTSPMPAGPTRSAIRS